MPALSAVTPTERSAATAPPPEPPTAGDLLGVEPLKVRVTHHGRWDAVALSPDGSRLIAWCDIACVTQQKSDGRVLVVELPSAKVRTINVAAGAAELSQRSALVAWSGAGSHFVVGEESSVAGWQLEPPQPSFVTNLSRVGGGFGVAPDGKLLLAAGGERDFRLVDATTGAAKARHKAADGLDGAAASTTVRWSPTSGHVVAIRSDGAVELFSTTGHLAQLVEPGGRMPDAAFALDGKTLAIALQTGVVTLWDVATRKPLRELVLGPTPDDALSLVDDPLEQVVFANDGKQLVALLQDRSVWFAPTDGGKPRALQAASATEGGGGVTDAWMPGAVQMSSDGRFAAWATTPDGAVSLWEVGSDQPPRTFRRIEGTHEASIVTVRFSPNGKRLAVEDGRHSELWDPATGKMLHRAISRAATGKHSRTFLPDGNTLVIADGRVSLLRASDGATLHLHVTTDGTDPTRFLYSGDGLFEGDPAICQQLLRHADSTGEERPFSEQECVERRRSGLANAFFDGKPL